MHEAFAKEMLQKEEYNKRLNARIGWQISSLYRYQVKEILRSLPEFMWDDLPTDDKGWEAYIIKQSRVDAKNVERHKVLRMQRAAGMPLNYTKSLYQVKDEIRHELVKTRIKRLNYQALLDEIQELGDDNSWKGDKKKDGDQRDLV